MPLIIVAVAIGAFGLAFVPSEIKNKRLDFAQGTARIDGNLIKVEIAKSAARKTKVANVQTRKVTIEFCNDVDL